jgi:hypothetical protein
VAGSIATCEQVASIEYAVAELGVKLILVLGHARCGAVKAALAGARARLGCACCLQRRWRAWCLGCCRRAPHPQAIRWHPWHPPRAAPSPSMPPALLRLAAGKPCPGYINMLVDGIDVPVERCRARPGAAAASPEQRLDACIREPARRARPPWPAAGWRAQRRVGCGTAAPCSHERAQQAAAAC